MATIDRNMITAPRYYPNAAMSNEALDKYFETALNVSSHMIVGGFEGMVANWGKPKKEPKND